jgi:hypothetical protein
LIFKKKLGIKYNLKWNAFILFLKDEYNRIKINLKHNTDKNILSEKNKNKFGIEKYTEISFNLDQN